MGCLIKRRLRGSYRRILLIVLLPVFLMLCGCGSKEKDMVYSADGVAISYEVQGAGEPALVFVHGWCCDRSYWKYQVPEFSKRHTVVTIDLAGHGRSGLGRGDWTIEAFGQDVKAVVEKLKLDNAILIGHSMGGMVIIEAARQMPERVTGLIGVDTYQDFEARYSREALDGFLMPFRENFAEGTRAYVTGLFPDDAEANLVERIAMDVSSAPPEVGISSLENYFDYDPKEALKEVRVPIRCINSDMFPLYVENNRRHALSFGVKFMSGVGHFLMMEDAETFNRLLQETINELSK